MTNKTKQKQTRNPEATKKRLLQAAIKVFAQKGPGAATVDEISEAAGLNKRLTYHYFGNKEGLYKNALQQIYDNFFSLDIELSSMLLPAEELLEMLVRRYYEFLEQHQDFVRMICFENLNEGKAAKELNLKDQKAPIITALQLALKKGQEEKRFRKDIDATDLLVSIFSLCFFYFSNSQTMGLFLENNSKYFLDLEKRVENVVELLLFGITPKKRK